MRDIYRLDSDHLLFVTSDRISAFDVVVDQGLPGEGRILTSIAAYWLEETRDIVPNHLVSTSIDEVDALDAEWRDRLRGRVMIVRETRRIRSSGLFADTSPDRAGRVPGGRNGLLDLAPWRAPSGIGVAIRSSRRPPSTRPRTDLCLPRRPRAWWRRSRGHGQDLCLKLFARGKEVLAGHDLILADTKFELGVRDGEVLLIDEALTPDSSRMWARADYEVGISPPSFDKQILRDWLETLDWNKQYPPPPLDPLSWSGCPSAIGMSARPSRAPRLSTEPSAHQGTRSPESLRPARPSHASMDVGETEVSTLQAVGEALVVDPEEVEHRRMKVVHVHRAAEQGEADLIGLAVRILTLEPPPVHPEREGLDMMVAPGLPVPLQRRAAELLPRRRACPPASRGTRGPGRAQLKPGRPPWPVPRAGSEVVVGVSVVVPVRVVELNESRSALE